MIFKISIYYFTRILFSHWIYVHYLKIYQLLEHLRRIGIENNGDLIRTVENINATHSLIDTNERSAAFDENQREGVYCFLSSQATLILNS